MALCLNKYVKRSHKIELVNELSAAQLAAFPRSFVTKTEYLIDTGTNLNIISRSTFNSLKDRRS